MPVCLTVPPRKTLVHNCNGQNSMGDLSERQKHELNVNIMYNVARPLYPFLFLFIDSSLAKLDYKSTVVI